MNYQLAAAFNVRCYTVNKKT